MLRYKSDFSNVGRVDRSVEPVKVPPVAVLPKVVQIMGGMDDEQIMKCIGRDAAVEIRAAMAVGKSVLIPQVLARATGQLVVHVAPNAAALYDTFRFMESKGNPVIYLSEPSHGFNDKYINLMTGATFCAKYWRDKLEGRENIIVYIDECHESDSFSGIIRTLAHALPEVSRVFYASATPVVTEVARIDPPAPVDVKPYAPGKVASWAGTDEGMPWSADAIKQHTMIALDRQDVVDRLAADYDARGLDVEKLTSKSDFKEWHRVSKSLAEKGVTTVVFVDSSFRSGITPVGIHRFLDSGEVAVPIVTDDGEAVVQYRDAYETEIKQFQGRAGRIKGSKRSVVYTPNRTPRRVAVHSTQVEADAMNLMYRMFGFKPPLIMNKYAFYEGDVPDDLGEALMSDHPVRLYPQDRLVPWVQSQPVVDKVEKKPGFVYQFMKRGAVDVGTEDTGGKAKKPGRGVSCHTVLDSPVFDDDVPQVPSVDRRFRAPHQRIESIASDNESSVVDVEVTRQVGGVTDRFSLMGMEEFAVMANAPDTPPMQQLQGNVFDGVNLSAPTRSSGPGATSRRGLRDNGSDGNEVVLGKSLPKLPDDDFYAAIAEHKREPVLRLTKEVESNASWLYYPGSEAAGRSWRFVDVGDVVRFTESSDFPVIVHGLGDSDVLVAMRLLTDAHNAAVTEYSAYNRVLAVIKKRDMAAWQLLVDKTKFVMLLREFMASMANADATARASRKAMMRMGRVPLLTLARHEEGETLLIRQLVERVRVETVESDEGAVANYLHDTGNAIMARNAARPLLL